MARHRIDRLLSLALEQPWAILPSKAQEIRGLLVRRVGGDLEVEEDELRAILAQVEAKQGRRLGGGRGVAVLPVVGTLGHRMNLLTESSGGVSTERLRGDFKALVADPTIDTIILDVDSPGGSVSDIPELAADIRLGARQKRVVAVANDLMASAAYWIASGASEIVVTPSGQVGSIGVLALHQDWSEFDAKAGVKHTLISAGEGKADGNMFEPLSDRARADMTEKVDAFYSLFVRAVASGRNVAQKTVKDVWQASMQTAEAAVTLGMADTVATLDQTLERFGVSRQGQTAKAQDESARLRAGRRARAGVGVVRVSAQGVEASEKDLATLTDAVARLRHTGTWYPNPNASAELDALLANLPPQRGPVESMPVEWRSFVDAVRKGYAELTDED